MNSELSIYHLIAHKIAGVATEEESKQLHQLTMNDPQLEEALTIIINSWNAPGVGNKREVELAFRKVSESLKNKKEEKTASRLSSRSWRTWLMLS